jgi:hypothetical protein
MTVRAKFKVTEITEVAWGDSPPGLKNITLLPVGGAAGGESAENKAFFAATPGGMVVLSVVNAQAAAQFEAGKSYYVDFSEAADAP